jgi:acyl dehydratase
MDPGPWHVQAVNLPDHAGNAIHTDAGARAAGFPGALVAGVTTYAYLTHPFAAAWGTEWLASGEHEVRFHAPVLAGDALTCRPSLRDDRWVVEAVVDRSASPLAVLTAGCPPAGADRTRGEQLPVEAVHLAGRWADYGARCGDDLDLYTREGLVHPAVWPALANQLVHTSLVRGPWIHVRSAIAHRAIAHVGDTVVVRGTVIGRSAGRRGERAVVDVRIDAEHGPVARLEHEAIVALAPG